MYHEHNYMLTTNARPLTTLHTITRTNYQTHTQTHTHTLSHTHTETNSVILHRTLSPANVLCTNTHGILHMGAKQTACELAKYMIALCYFWEHPSISQHAPISHSRKSTRNISWICHKSRETRGPARELCLALLDTHNDVQQRRCAWLC